ncbi:MAG: TonB family protein [Gemmatimonadales bacterium]|nr:TonB family protein [Gemmatimonadales bacterium]NIN50677.1 TonB family protein [Gemmatimonadales bacterium]NIP08141.1 TonB family protein [Gemmatimonadales bacterium]NIR01019.1 TonB family protein [Gemmatimonadales bacterium]NIS65098.1 TonB family protein [Gemmatimonadales bacterium]
MPGGNFRRDPHAVGGAGRQPRGSGAHRGTGPGRDSVFDFTPDEAARIHKALRTPDCVPQCPQDGVPLTVEGPIALGGHRGVVWLVACPSCRRNLVVPARPKTVRAAPRFSTLVESNPGKRGLHRPISSAVFAVAVHAAVIYGAVIATLARPEGGASEAASDTTLLMLYEPPEQEPQERQPRPVERFVALSAPPKGFQTLTLPIGIPTEIPSIDLTQRFDPRDYSGEGVEGGIFAGVPGVNGSADNGEIFAAAAVEQPPERLYGPTPDYPGILLTAAIEGYVVVDFVVNADGRVDPSSIKVISTSHRGFNNAAIKAVRETMFRPGKTGGVPVRVRVRQRVNFTLTVAPRQY